MGDPRSVGPAYVARGVFPPSDRNCTPASSSSSFPDGEESRAFSLQAAKQRGAQLLRNFTLRRRLGLLPGGDRGASFSFSSFTSPVAERGGQTLVTTPSPLPSSGSSADRGLIAPSHPVSVSSAETQESPQNFISAPSSSHAPSSEQTSALRPASTTEKRSYPLPPSSDLSSSLPQTSSFSSSSSSSSADSRPQTRELLRPFASLRLQLASAAALARQQRNGKASSSHVEGLSAVSSSPLPSADDAIEATGNELSETSSQRGGGAGKGEPKSVTEKEETAKLPPASRTSTASSSGRKNDSQRQAERHSPPILSGDEEGRRLGGVPTLDTAGSTPSRSLSRKQTTQDLSIERKGIPGEGGVGGSALPASRFSSPPCASRSGADAPVAAASALRRGNSDLGEEEGARDREMLVRAMIIEEQREMISSLETTIEVLRARIEELHQENENLRLRSARGLASLRRPGLFSGLSVVALPSRRKGGESEAGEEEGAEEGKGSFVGSQNRGNGDGEQPEEVDGEDRVTSEEEPSDEAGYQRQQHGLRRRVYGTTRRKTEDSARGEYGRENGAGMNEAEVEEIKPPRKTKPAEEKPTQGNGVLVQKMELYRRELLQLCVENEQLRDLLRKKKEEEEEEAEEETRRIPLRRYSSKELKHHAAHPLPAGVPDVADKRTYVLSRPQFGEVPPPLLM